MSEFEELCRSYGMSANDPDAIDNLIDMFSEDEPESRWSMYHTEHNGSYWVNEEPGHDADETTYYVYGYDQVRVEIYGDDTPDHIPLAAPLLIETTDYLTPDADNHLFTVLELLKVEPDGV